MLTRLAIILTFALQPLWLSADPVRGQMPASCGAISCCEVIETTTCCGEKIVQIVCGKTGGECVCVADPETPRQPSPVPPQRSSSEWMPVPTLRATGIVIDWAPAPRVRAQSVSHVLTPGSHNTAQAMMGVWLT